jgi:hypothetical protein
MGSIKMGLTKVSLTPTQVALAKRLGVPLEVYAREMQRAQLEDKNYEQKLSWRHDDTLRGWLDDGWGEPAPYTVTFEVSGINNDDISITFV